MYIHLILTLGCIFHEFARYAMLRLRQLKENNPGDNAIL